MWYVHRKRETRFPDGHLGFPVLLDSERKRTQSTTRDVTPLISIIKAAKLFFVLLARAPPFSHIFTLKEKHSAVIIGNNKVPSETFLSHISMRLIRRYSSNLHSWLWPHTKRKCGLLSRSVRKLSCYDTVLCSQDFNMKQEYQQKRQQNIILLVF